MRISGTLHQEQSEEQMHHIFLVGGTAIIASMIGASPFAQSAATGAPSTPPVSQCHPLQYTSLGEIIHPAGMKLMEPHEPQAAINDIIVQVMRRDPLRVS
jgi:hypothetical protein